MTPLNPSVFIPFLHLKSCSSTQDRVIERGGVGWFLVWADRQTEGRGRRDAKWSSPPGGLYYTLRYPASRHGASAALQVMGAALCWIRTLRNRLEGSGNLSLKWPNDLLLNGRKLCGLIGETRSGHLNLGVGMNVNNAVRGDSEGFDAPAVSLREATGRHWSRRGLLFAWLRRFGEALRGGDPACFDPSRLQQHLDTIGREVRIGDRRGTAVGLHGDGGLLLSVRGESEIVYSGDPVEVPYP